MGTVTGTVIYKLIVTVLVQVPAPGKVPVPATIRSTRTVLVQNSLLHSLAREGVFYYRTTLL
jgi:hypothetical protein